MATQTQDGPRDPSTRRPPSDRPHALHRFGGVVEAAWRRLQSTKVHAVGAPEVSGGPDDHPTDFLPPEEVSARVSGALRVALDSIPAGSLSAGVRRRLEATVRTELISALTGEDRVARGAATQDRA